MSDQKRLSNILKHYDFNPDTYLSEIFAAQKKFGSKFCPFDSLGADYQSLRHWVNEFCTCIMDELSEIIGWTPWKHWKNYKPDFVTEWEEIRFELIDVLHFAVSIALALNIAPKDLSLKDIFNTEDISVSDSLSPLDIANRFKTWTRAILCDISELLRLRQDYYFDVKELFQDLSAGFKMVGMSEQDIYDYYMSKNQENFDRQERGY
jgi:dimeric dUTPase (all-alpha-NTP-PPase superfamily)